MSMDDDVASRKIESFDEAMQFLASQTNYEQNVEWSYRRLDEQLPAFADFLEQRLEAPQRRLPWVIHVAGTKGKGSTCLMLEAALREQGLRTGVYTSPHLCHITERIRLDGESISPGEFARLLERLRPELAAWPTLPGRWPITFFEILTAMALVAFAEAQLDVVLLEVGLGGRLDATNVVDADVAVITSIGRDHTDKLGDTLEGIAREKAGILKPARIGVIGAMPSAKAAQAVREVAAHCEPPPTLRMADEAAFGVERTSAGRVRMVSRPWPALGLEGLALETGVPRRPPATDMNLACAVEALRALSGGASTGALAGLALEQAFASGARCSLPARLEPMRGTRHSGEPVEVILDSAHNASSLAAVADWLAGRTPTVLIGLNRDKLAADVLAPLTRVASRVICTTVPGSPRAASAGEVASAWREAAGGGGDTCMVEEVGDAIEALAYALEVSAAGSASPLLITGSVYLAGALRSRLQPGDE